MKLTIPKRAPERHLAHPQCRTAPRSVGAPTHPSPLKEALCLGSSPHSPQCFTFKGCASSSENI